MTDRHDTEVEQETITGDRLDLKRAECEYHDACSHSAQVVVEQLVYGEGIVETLACKVCASEFREYAAEERVRKLKPSEKWANT